MALTEAVVLFDADTRRPVFMNPAAQTMFGRTLAEFQEGGPTEVFREDGSLMPWNEYPSVLAFEDRRSHTATVGFRSPGGMIWVHENAVPLFRRESTEPYGVLSLFTDVSTLVQAFERVRESEQLSRAIMAASFEAVVLFEDDGAVIGVNRAAERMLGRSSDELLGQTVFDFLAERSREPAERLLDDLVAGLPRTGATRLEGCGLRADGSEFPIEVTLERIERVRGSVAVAFISDATERRETESVLAGARDAALRTARMKSQFLATMSHELRTPMNGVIGALDLVLDSSLAPEQRELVSIAHASAYNLLAIIDDVLDLSKIEADKLDPSPVDIELATIVEEVTDVVAIPARRKDLTVTSFVDPDLPRWLLADPRLIRQVLVNLVGNAVKFTSAGRINVRAELVRTVDGTATVLFSVEDTGKGISADALSTLFDPFTQVDSTSTREHGGTGLGLAIAFRLVRLMGGDLRAWSAEGSGSLFSFTLDLEWSARTDDPRLSGAGTPRRVLLVEPNLDAAEGISRYLAAWGIDIDHAVDAEGADRVVAAMSNDRLVDCVIVSAEIPGTDVGALIERIRRRVRPKAIRVIGLTDIGSPLRRLTEASAGPSTRAIGFDVVVTKPVKESRLFDAIVSGDAVHDAAPATPPVDGLTLGTILLAEDNTVNQRVLSAQLTRIGFSVEAVGNGREAVVAFTERGPFTAILMDCQMPLMDGYDATVAIRKHENPSAARMLIVAVTANAMQEDRDRCIAAGMDDYVTKPVTIEGLTNVLNPVLTAAAARAAAPVDPFLAVGDTSRPAAVDQADVARLAVDLGDEETFHHIAGIFLEQVESGIGAIGAAIREGSGEELARQAHRLKSSAATFGAHGLTSLLVRLEQAGTSADLVEAGRIGLVLAPEAERVRVELGALLADRLTAAHAA